MAENVWKLDSFSGSAKCNVLAVDRAECVWCIHSIVIHRENSTSICMCLIKRCKHTNNQNVPIKLSITIYSCDGSSGKSKSKWQNSKTNRKFEREIKLAVDFAHGKSNVIKIPSKGSYNLTADHYFEIILCSYLVHFVFYYIKFQIDFDYLDIIT